MSSTTVAPETLPVYQLRPQHTYAALVQYPAQGFAFRVHTETETGCLKPHGFVAPLYADFVPDRIPWIPLTLDEKPEPLANKHIMQWHNDEWPFLDSPYISCSMSLAYALWEAARWNRRWRCQSTQISVIDLSKLRPGGDVRMGVELVGAFYNTAAYYSRWAQEILIVGHIPRDAVVFTGSFEVMSSFLPTWCNTPVQQIREQKVGSTQRATEVLQAAALADGQSQEARKALMDHVVSRSIELHQEMHMEHLPQDFGEYSEYRHRPIVDEIAKFASIFCWWPRRMTRSNPTEYSRLLNDVRASLQTSLRLMADAARDKKLGKVKMEFLDLPKTPSRGGAPIRREPVKKEPDYVTQRPIKRQY
ncbi:hypothetical protein MKEN_01089900 [Mycena kentingensis (nom. inval.)]|nr:hypothetical protein MKEN_01089900 [Mycena kentingensis (nom. inval.)]